MDIDIPDLMRHSRSFEDAAWYSYNYLAINPAFRPIYGPFRTYFNIKLVSHISILILEGKMSHYLEKCLIENLLL